MGSAGTLFPRVLLKLLAPEACCRLKLTALGFQVPSNARNEAFKISLLADGQLSDCEGSNWLTHK